MRQIEKAAEEWQAAGIIDERAATGIVEYERGRVMSGNSVGLVIFAILGSILIALGIVLIVAENWDEIPRNQRIIIAFVPLVAGQVLTALALFRYPASQAWREASAAFLLLVTGATLGVISQIFQLQGTTVDFLLLWLICTVPVPLITRSVASAILFLILSTWFAVLSYWQYSAPVHYLWMIGAMGAFLIWQIIGYEKKRAVAIAFGWLFAASVGIAYGLAYSHSELWAVVGYMLLFQCYSLFSRSGILKVPDGWKTGFFGLGFAGSVVILFLMTQRFFIADMGNDLKWEKLTEHWPAFTALVLSIALYALLIFKDRDRLNISNVIFPVFVAEVTLAMLDTGAAQVAGNLFLLTFAVLLMLRGLQQRNLVVLNTGLLIFAILVIMRFFDFHLSFAVRGVAFLLMGALFFAGNRMILKNTKEEKNEA